MTFKEKLSLIKFASKAKLLAPILNKAQGGARLLGSAASKRLAAADSKDPTSKLQQLANKPLPQTTSTTAQTTLIPNSMEKHKLLKYFLGSTPANAAVR